MILFPITAAAPPNEVRGFFLTNPFSLAFKSGAPPTTAAPPITRDLTNFVFTVRDLTDFVFVRRDLTDFE